MSTISSTGDSGFFAQSVIAATMSGVSSLRKTPCAHADHPEACKSYSIFLARLAAVKNYRNRASRFFRRESNLTHL